MEKICLNSSPSSLLDATIGQVFELDERTFILEGDSRIYLTLLETDGSVWHREKDRLSSWAHVRSKAGYALMTRQEMCDILESGNYFIE